jgi:hypothetical protein
MLTYAILNIIPSKDLIDIDLIEPDPLVWYRNLKNTIWSWK